MEASDNGSCRDELSISRIYTVRGQDLAKTCGEGLFPNDYVMP